jgi:hypothetical protein
MRIENYFEHDFQKDIAKLQFNDVPQVLRDILNDADLLLFGGKNWSNLAQDLEHIETDVRPAFILCLFAVVATDQCMQSYFKSHYPRWRAQTAYPKFGWVRFGLYNENPLKLFSVPEKAQLVDTAQALSLMSEFVVFYRQLLNDYCTAHAPDLSADLFFNRLLQDKIMDLDDGALVASFKAMAAGLITHTSKRPYTGADFGLAA